MRETTFMQTTVQHDGFGQTLIVQHLT